MKMQDSIALASNVPKKVQVNFRIEKETYLLFKEEVRSRGLSVCHVLEAFMKSVLAAEKLALASPVTIKVEHIVKRPRRIITGEIVPEDKELSLDDYKFSTVKGKNDFEAIERRKKARRWLSDVHGRDPDWLKAQVGSVDWPFASSAG